MIPEREREALMRLTMCAREECRICMYQKRCDFDFQCELATKNMNILADALRVDRKTEPTISKMEQVEDEPQTDWHYDEQDATWYPYKHEDEPQIFICPIQNDYEALIEDEPQTERSE